MLQKLLTFVLLIVSVSAISFAQQTSDSKEKPKTPVGIFFDNEKSYLGIQTQEISKENFAKFGLSEVRGVAVEKVVENSPAAQAGLQKGDVIIRLNGETVSSVRKLTRLISEVAPDHKITLSILRGGNESEISAILGKREFSNFEMNDVPFEDMSPLPRIQSFPRPMLPPMQNGESRGFIWRGGERRQIGINVTPLTKQLADYFGVASGKGLLVDSVRADSPAAKADLKAGDIIIEADGKEVSGNTDLIRVINEKKEGSVTLTIIRDKNRQTLIVTPEKVRMTITPAIQSFEGFSGLNLS